MDNRLAFLLLHKIEAQDGYVEAVLTTDIKSKPLEFRCTHPVKPNIVQKTLYGEMLERYIGVELCGINLLKSLKLQPDLVIVNQDFLLDIRNSIDIPAVYVYRAGEVTEIKISTYEASPNVGQSSKREKIENLMGRFQPVVIVPSYYFEGDIEDGRKIAQEAFQYFDLLEPFERMIRAIDIIIKQDKRFQSD